MAKKIKYVVRFQLAGGAIVANKIVEAKDLADLRKKVKKLYGKDILLLQWSEV